MAQELLYTSAPRGLKPGSRGFCTVLSTHGMSAPLATAVEALSGYRPIYPASDANSSLNPIVYSHLKLQATGRSWHVLSRIADYGLDYSQRANKLAHHVILDNTAEQLPGGPANLLSMPGFMRTEWSGDPKVVDLKPVKHEPPGPSGICRHWQQMTGDAGWAGVLAESFLKDPDRLVILLFKPGQQILPLFAEAIALLSLEERWNVTFSTYFTGLVTGTTCQWRAMLHDSKDAHDSLRFAAALRIDLTQVAIGKAAGGELADAARTGEIAKSPGLPLPTRRLQPPPIESPSRSASPENRYTANQPKHLPPTYPTPVSPRLVERKQTRFHLVIPVAFAFITSVLIGFFVLKSTWWNPINSDPLPKSHIETAESDKINADSSRNGPPATSQSELAEATVRGQIVEAAESIPSTQTGERTTDVPLPTQGLAPGIAPKEQQTLTERDGDSASPLGRAPVSTLKLLQLPEPGQSIQLATIGNASTSVSTRLYLPDWVPLQAKGKTKLPTANWTIATSGTDGTDLYKLATEIPATDDQLPSVTLTKEASSPEAVYFKWALLEIESLVTIDDQHSKETLDVRFLQFPQNPQIETRHFGSPKWSIIWKTQFPLPEKSVPSITIRRFSLRIGTDTYVFANEDRSTEGVLHLKSDTLASKIRSFRDHPKADSRSKAEIHISPARDDIGNLQFTILLVNGDDLLNSSISELKRKEKSLETSLVPYKIKPIKILQDSASQANEALKSNIASINSLYPSRSTPQDESHTDSLNDLAQPRSFIKELQQLHDRWVKIQRFRSELAQAEIVAGEFQCTATLIAGPRGPNNTISISIIDFDDSQSVPNMEVELSKDNILPSSIPGGSSK